MPMTEISRVVMAAEPAPLREHSQLGLLSRALPASAFRHWLVTLNVCLAAYLAGGLAAPLLAASGWASLAGALYAVYHLMCHQWAFRSFFLLAPPATAASGDQAGGLAIYSQQQLTTLGVDPFTFTGSANLGWKMAFCERDLAIYLGLLAVGLLYARQRQLKPLSFSVYALLILPMAVDGFTQLFGWRESTWQLRVSTGLLFGLASAWLVLPRLNATFGLAPAARQYSPDGTCAPAPVIPALTTAEPHAHPHPHKSQAAPSPTPISPKLSPRG